VARRVGVDPYTVWRWHKKGLGPDKVKLRAVKVGGRWRTRWRWVKEFFAAMETPAPAPEIQTRTERQRQQEAAERELKGWAKPWKRL